MTLSVLVMHYLCSVTLIVILFWLAHQNRKSGWRRQRIPPEKLLRWHIGRGLTDPASPNPEEVSRQLAAFQAALLGAGEEKRVEQPSAPVRA